ncbi:MAG: hypothetical protein Kow0096_25620 [Thiohalomonadaceae bacterium]
MVCQPLASITCLCPGYFFAKFIAGPVGLLVSGFVFLVYDSLWPQQAARKDE